MTPDESMTEENLRAAEERRKRRAEEVFGPRPYPHTPDDTAEACRRLYSTIQAHPIKVVETNDQTAVRIAELQRDWHAPKRHLETVVRQNCEAWWKTLLNLSTRLNTGFIFALVGPRGPGKTQMGVELMKIQTSQLRSARYCTALDFFIDLKSCFDTDRNQRRVLDQYAAPRLLVIDEAQERGETPWEDRMLTYLINRRYNDRKDTLLISNQTAKEFWTAIGPSVASRMSETGSVIECTWPSFREGA